MPENNPNPESAEPVVPVPAESASAPPDVVAVVETTDQPSTETPAEEPAEVLAEVPADVPAEGMVFREPVKTIRSGGTVIELRRLSPEEIRTRRARRNLIILVAGAAILVALVMLLATRR
jgi:hypothetical protein